MNAQPLIDSLEPRALLSVTPQVVASLSPDPVDLAIVDSADFDRDGIDDLLLRNVADGHYVIWLMQTLQTDGQVPMKQAVDLPAAAASWEIVAAGDLSGDGKPDLLWHNANARATNVWTLDGTSVIEARRIATGGASPTPWKPIDLADVNNDSRTDIIWTRPTPAPARYTAWYKTDDSSLLTYTYGGLPYPADAAWNIHSFADFNLDGKTDAFLTHRDGRRIIWQLDNKQLLKTISLGQANNASNIVLADIDDDGDRDLIYQAKANYAQTFITRLNKAALDNNLFQ